MINKEKIAYVVITIILATVNGIILWGFSSIQEVSFISVYTFSVILFMSFAAEILVATFLILIVFDVLGPEWQQNKLAERIIKFTLSMTAIVVIILFSGLSVESKVVPIEVIGMGNTISTDETNYIPIINFSGGPLRADSEGSIMVKTPKGDIVVDSSAFFFSKLEYLVRQKEPVFATLNTIKLFNTIKGPMTIEKILIKKEK